MSDRDVMLAIEEMETCLKGDLGELDPRMLDEWQQKFQNAVATSERGADWASIAARAQAVHLLLEDKLKNLVAQRDSIRRELEGQAVGQRALSAYKPGQGR